MKKIFLTAIFFALGFFAFAHGHFHQYCQFYNEKISSNEYFYECPQCQKDCDFRCEYCGECFSTVKEWRESLLNDACPQSPDGTCHRLICQKNSSRPCRRAK